MSTLHPGDEDMHYHNSSHRWIAPPNIDQDVWNVAVRAHQAEHFKTMGGPPRESDTDLVARYAQRYGLIAEREAQYVNAYARGAAARRSAS